MKPNYTHIQFLLDSSGSMRGLTHDTIGGVNGLIAEHKKAPGECTIGIESFSTWRWPVRERCDVQKIAPLGDGEYIAVGGTALNDAMADAIDQLGSRLARLPEHERPSKVIFVVITDGEENSSMRFWGAEGKLAVKNRVEHQTNRYGWDFMYLGANVDAFAVAASYGVGWNSTSNYVASPAGCSRMYGTIASASVRTRSAMNTNKGSATGVNTTLTEEEQKKNEEGK